LNLGYAQITNAGLKELAASKDLRALHLGATPVTLEGILELHRRLPECLITH
jgi:hypothetical protein